MSRIFISYRREDSDIWAGRLADELREHFPPEQVFQDIASIDPGADFRTALDEALATAAAMLVVIGPRWLSAGDRSGRKRLESPADFVHQEVAESLRHPGIRVFPLLVNGAEMPTEDDLPEPLKPLARRQAFELTVRHWANDVAQLVQTLKRAPGLVDIRATSDEAGRQRAEQEAKRRGAEERTEKESRRSFREEARGRAAEDEARRKAAIGAHEEVATRKVAGSPTRKFSWKPLAAVGTIAAVALLVWLGQRELTEPPSVSAAASSTAAASGDKPSTSLRPFATAPSALTHEAPLPVGIKAGGTPQPARAAAGIKAEDLELTADKAQLAPGDTVKLTAKSQQAPANGKTLRLVGPAVLEASALGKWAACSGVPNCFELTSFAVNMPAVLELKVKAGATPGIFTAVLSESGGTEIKTLGLEIVAVSASPRSGRYALKACGSISDAKTKLEWLVGPDKNMTWDEARSWSNSLFVCGGGWQMPTTKQLATLYDASVTAGTGFSKNGRHYPAHIDQIFNGIGSGSWVWSSEAGGSQTASSFNFSQNVEVELAKNNSIYTVRAFAVRSAQ